MMLNNPKSRLGILIGVGLFLIGIASDAADSTNVTAKSDFSSFKIITDRNIFNPRRSRTYVPSSERSSRRTRRSEWFALTGTMAYEKGPFAFFDGTTSDYRKVLGPQDTIGAFKIAAIDKHSVKLVSATNEIELKVGMQMRKEESGEWTMSERVETFEPAASSSSSSRFATTFNTMTNNTAQTNGSTEEGAFVGNDDGENPAASAPSAASAGSGVTETDPVLRRLAERAAAERGENPR